MALGPSPILDKEQVEHLFGPIEKVWERAQLHAVYVHVYIDEIHKNRGFSKTTPPLLNFFQAS